MDAVIRFCFSGVRPEELGEDEYVKLYGQAKYCWDYMGFVTAKKVIDSIA